MQSKNCSIHKTLPNESDQKGAYRFLKNKNVSEAHLIDGMKKQCSSSVNGKRVLVICDTSTISLESHKNRITDFNGLGRISTNQHKKNIGFHIHPLLVLDEKDNTPLGISAVNLIARPMKNRFENEKEKHLLSTIPIEEKESFKWIGPCIESRDNILSQAEHATFVMDREADITEVFARVPNEKTDIVIRSRHNRKILNDKGQKVKLYDHIFNQKAYRAYEIGLNSKQGKRRIHKAKVAMKWGNIQLRPGKSFKNLDPIRVSYVEVKQINTKGEKIEEPIHWIILSSKEIRSEKEAKEIINIYKRRWSIEIFFKLLKSDGYNIGKTELESGKGIRKLTLILMSASIRLLQLKAARDGQTDLKMKDVFSESEIECLELLNDKYQGKTEKQKNPYPREHLSWGSWVIARMAGWKEFYNKKRPPGNKTFSTGLEKFHSIMIMFNILNDKDVS